MTSRQQHTCVSVSHSVVSDSVTSCGLYPARLLGPWDSPGKTTAVGCQFLLQGLFLTHGSNLGSPTLQAESLPSEPPGKPSIGPFYEQCCLLNQQLQQRWTHPRQTSSEQNGTWARLECGSSAEHLRSI